MPGDADPKHRIKGVEHGKPIANGHYARIRERLDGACAHARATVWKARDRCRYSGPVRYRQPYQPQAQRHPDHHLGHGSAGNDASCEDPAISEAGTDAWARHALAANGFGDGAITDTVPSAWPSSYEMHRAARAHRSWALGKIIIAAIHAASAITRRALARHQQRRQARVVYNAFRQFDDRSLRDLGFDRSEIDSLAAEVTGEAECTRVRALQTSHGLPK